MKKQIHAYFNGNVQNVGFRFTVREIANKLGVFGWVKNLSDGRVEVLAEAEEALLKEFLSQLNAYFSRYIQDVNIDWKVTSADFKDFEIEF